MRRVLTWLHGYVRKFTRDEVVGREMEAVSFDKAEAADMVSVRDPSIVQIGSEEGARKFGK
jgi:hypothetical protein